MTSCFRLRPAQGRLSTFVGQRSSQFKQQFRLHRLLVRSRSGICVWLSKAQTFVVVREDICVWPMCLFPVNEQSNQQLKVITLTVPMRCLNKADFFSRSSEDAKDAGV